MRSDSVEESRGGMGEVAFGHEVVGLEDAIDVAPVDAHSDTHDHLLGTLGDAAVYP